MSHVVVRLGGGRFALPMDAVAEVGRTPTLTRVPGTPGWVRGVGNWRGRILAVLDLRLLLGIAPADVAEEGLVVLSRGGAMVGVLAERVDGVIDIDVDTLEPALMTLPAEAEALLEGQLTDEQGPVGVVDAGAVFGLRHRVGVARRAG
ncbi:MAG TPA: chemotaxis protein CheW [Frankiaceae bacterium]|nr:chemotaxis protein CheW [Frankiaceae bacterium]